MTKAISVCLVGAGRAGQVHAESLTRHIPEGQLTALVDPNITALESVGINFGVEARFTALAEAIDRVPFEAVVTHEPFE